MKEKKPRKLMVLPPLNNTGYPIAVDPLGMYTGLTSDPEEVPQQDADNL